MIVFAYDTNTRLAIIHPVAHKQKEITQFNEPKFCTSETCRHNTSYGITHCNV